MSTSENNNNYEKCKTSRRWGLVMDSKHLYIKGLNRDKEVWCSSAVLNIINSNTIKTFSGSTYTLIGPMDENWARLRETPEVVIKSFKNGFPDNWREIINPYLKSVNSNLEQNHSDNKYDIYPKLDNNKSDDQKLKMGKVSSVFYKPELPDCRTRSGRVVKRPSKYGFSRPQLSPIAINNCSLKTRLKSKQMLPIVICTPIQNDSSSDDELLSPSFSKELERSKRKKTASFSKLPGTPVTLKGITALPATRDENVPDKKLSKINLLKSIIDSQPVNKLSQLEKHFDLKKCFVELVPLNQDQINVDSKKCSSKRKYEEIETLTNDFPRVKLIKINHNSSKIQFNEQLNLKSRILREKMKFPKLVIERVNEKTIKNFSRRKKKVKAENGLSQNTDHVSQLVNISNINNLRSRVTVSKPEKAPSELKPKKAFSEAKPKKSKKLKTVSENCEEIFQTTPPKPQLPLKLAGKGTFKREEQIREFIQQSQNEQYSEEAVITPIKGISNLRSILLATPSTNTKSTSNVKTPVISSFVLKMMSQPSCSSTTTPSITSISSDDELKVSRSAIKRVNRRAFNRKKMAKNNLNKKTNVQTGVKGNLKKNPKWVLPECLKDNEDIIDDDPESEEDYYFDIESD